MLTKHNVCLFIKDEEHLEEMRVFLESKGENICEPLFSFHRKDKFYLEYDELANDWFILSEGNLDGSTILVTTEKFKNLFI